MRRFTTGDGPPRQCWAGSIEIGVMKREWGKEEDRLGWVGETGEWGGAGRRREEEGGVKREW